jgi:hypothetical protein
MALFEGFISVFFQFRRAHVPPRREHISLRADFFEGDRFAKAWNVLISRP